jgi:hypothetical protein
VRSDARAASKAMQRWTSRFRPALFGAIRWQDAAVTMDGAGWLRLGTDFAVELWTRLADAAHLYSKKDRALLGADLTVAPPNDRSVGR